MPSPIKVTVTSRAQLNPGADFFTTGDTEKIVYCSSGSVALARDRLGEVATVVDGGQPVDLRKLTQDLYARGVGRLMVEGGGTMHTQFLTADLADELHLVVAPFFVGDSRAKRFVSDGMFPWNPKRRAKLAEVRQIGDVVLLRYALSPRFGTPSCSKRVTTVLACLLLGVVLLAPSTLGGAAPAGVAAGADRRPRRRGARACPAGQGAARRGRSPPGRCWDCLPWPKSWRWVSPPCSTGRSNPWRTGSFSPRAWVSWSGPWEAWARSRWRSARCC